MAATYRFSFPTPIHFGAGVRSQLPAHLRTAGFSRPLVVTDKGLGELPIFKDLMKNLDATAKPGAFSGIWGNPGKSQVLAGVKAFRDHKADSIVGFGGGAALDVAKAIALMIHHPGDLFDYEDDKPGGLPVDKDIPYWVALPTTSGTGSEVGRSAVVSDDETHLKKIIFHPRLLARAVFADPELTFALPAKVTAATGMDALTHCVEAYFAKGYHPICDGIAMEGIRLSAKSLAAAVRKPQDLEARSDMMMSSMMGAIAFQKGLGLVHSCAHALSTVCDLHHGLANGIMIDHALKHNLKAIPERFAAVARMLDLKDGDVLKWLAHLKAECGIPAKLSEAGVKREHLARLVEVATADVCHGSNPTPVTADDFRRIFTEALG